MTKRLLLLQASDDVPGCEIDLVNNVIAPFDIVLEHVDVRQVGDLDGIPEVLFDYVYICGHADKTCFGGSGAAGDRDVRVLWPELSAAICTKLATESTAILACCRGGLNQVAWDVFIGCDKIDTVIGSLGEVHSEDLRLAFHTILYNVEHRGEHPDVAGQRACAATGRTFRVFDRDDVEVDASFVQYDSWGNCMKYPEMCTQPVTGEAVSELPSDSS